MKRYAIAFVLPAVIFVVIAASTSQWLFLIGIAWVALLAALDWLVRRDTRRRQVIRSGDGSTNIQAGRDIHLN